MHPWLLVVNVQIQNQHAVMSVHLTIDSSEFNLEERINYTAVSEEFDSDGITATLEWMQRNSLYSYQVRVVPPSRQNYNITFPTSKGAL